MSPSAKPSKTKPLSAYNLFFQYNRIKLLASNSGGRVVAPSESAFACPPGLEDVNPNSPLMFGPVIELNAHRKKVIEHALDNSPFNAKNGKRTHRKAAQGSMTFLEMSNFMSTKWNDADETTKILFRELSAERKAKAQKLEFDSYKKAAQKFSLTPKAPVPSAEIAVPRRVVSYETVGSSTRVAPNVKSNDALRNAAWKESSHFNGPYGGMTMNRVAAGENGIMYGYNPRVIAVENNVANTSNFNWEKPMAMVASDLDQNGVQKTIYRAQELIDRPLSFIRKDEKMTSDEVRDWLSGLDWGKI